MKIFVTAILILILSAGSVFSQDNLLVNFTAQQIENYVHLNFTVKGGISCLGTEVQRSIDDVHFETIGIFRVFVAAQKIKIIFMMIHCR